MNSKQQHIARVIIRFLFSTTLILIPAIIIFHIFLHQKIREKLQQLPPEFHVKFSSLHFNLFATSVYINDLYVRFTPDTNCLKNYHIFRIPRSELRGTNILKLLFHKKISIQTLSLEKSDITLEKFIVDNNDSLMTGLFSRMNLPIEKITIYQVQFTNANICLHAGNENLLMFYGDITLHEADINDMHKPNGKDLFHLGGIDCDITNLDYIFPGGKHSLYIKRVILKRKPGILKIDSLEIITQSDAKGSRNLDYIEASVREIEINQPDLTYLLNQKLIAEKIMIKGCSVTAAVDGRFPSAFVKKILPEIKADTFNLNQFAIAYKDQGNKFSLKGDITFYQPIIKKTENSLTIDNVQFSGLDCRVSDIHYSIPKVYHDLYINKLVIDNKKKSLQIDLLKLLPEYGKFEFSRKMGKQADRIEATIPGIEITDLDVKKLIQNKLMAGKIEIQSCQANVFRDRRIKRKLQTQPLPVSYMKEIPLEIRVKTLKINNATIIYEEFPIQGSQSGILKIERIRVSLSPFINHHLNNDPDHMDMKVEGSIMGSGSISASISLPFTHQKEYFVDGAIKDLELTTLNSSAENLGSIHIESGLLNYLSFRFSFNEKKANGKIVGVYHNLIIDKLKSAGNYQKKKAWFKSFMLKHLIIPLNKDKSLPERKRTGRIDYQRDPTRFISHYLLQSLLTGVKASFTLGFLLPR